MNQGQQSALEQLHAIEQQAGGDFEVIQERHTAPSKLGVDISLSCESISGKPGGIKLRQRERFALMIPEDFPFTPPSVWSAHTRWDGHPHVQWQKYICLYQATAIEWNPSDGMFGLIERLHHWLERAANDDLDPEGAPIHPPVAYVSDGSLPLIVPRVDTPEVDDTPWVGFGIIRQVSEHRVDITGWEGVSGVRSEESVAAAVLLPLPGGFEFPERVSDLIEMCEERGVTTKLLLSVLGLGALINGHGHPLIVLVGTPSRGIRGGDTMRQHLVAWQLGATIADGLRIALRQSDADEKMREIGAKAEGLIRDWAKEAKVAWCKVSEARPEVTVSRDEATAINWFRGRRVAVWGCGALGAHMAEYIARAGAAHLTLYDKGRVTLGLLVRQPYEDLDVGRNKTAALRDRLLRISPELEVVAESTDVLRGLLDTDRLTNDFDLILDATASPIVSKKLELVGRAPHERPTVASVGVDHNAKRALLLIAGPEYSGLTADLARKAKIEVLRRVEFESIADDFWPEQAIDAFQPEPGCSEPTFIGGQAALASLAGSMLEALADHLSSDTNPSGNVRIFSAPNLPDASRLALALDVASDTRLKDPVSNYDVRIAPSAQADLIGWIRRAHRTEGPEVETGGHLWGEIDEALGVAWITEVTGPPPDSLSDEDGFRCGFAGVDRITEERERTFKGAMRFIGMWHTHPQQPPFPSATDIAAMRLITTTYSPPRGLLLIVGENIDSTGVMGAYLFHRDKPIEQTGMNGVQLDLSQVTGSVRDVGIALSGGGSRAIAFQLGCLKALHDRGVLNHVAVVSGVSGGAILAAMYGYTHDSFESFQERVEALLREGLTSRFLRRFLLSRRLPQSLASWVLAVAAGRLLALRKVVSGKRFQAWPRRWVSRTSAFEDVLADSLFDDTLMTADTRDGIGVVITATELRTGTAFRFGSAESGNWRLGRLRNPEVRVSHAVAASAAYPTLLPGFEEDLIFVGPDGGQVVERVLLSDGGIFDNLGTTCMEPDRLDNISTNVFKPKFIISCDAGRGSMDEGTIPIWWPERVARAAESVFRKSQDSIRRRLFHFQETGQLEGFILSYLGTLDERLPAPPADLVRRDTVSDYPTDFSAMSKPDLDRLALRGEQLTRLLITRYLPDL